jgi:hypothetical protein
MATETPMSVVDELVAEMSRQLDLHLVPKHSHDPASSLTHTLNVSRRHGTPHVPKHCACVMCSRGRSDQHIPAVSR